MENKTNVTEHAFDRAKERLKWKSSVLQKESEKAYEYGITHSDTKGSLNKYITKLWFDYKQANNIRILGENIFIFRDNILITVYQMPFNMRKHVKRCNSKKIIIE